MKELTDAGYTIEFLATDDVFTDGSTEEAQATSDSGKLIDDLNAIEEFKYQVVISKDGEEVAKSEPLQTVKVVVKADIVTEISGFEVYINRDENNHIKVTSGKLVEGADEAKIVVLGRTEATKADADPENITEKVDLTSSSNSRVSVADNGNLTLNGVLGEVTLTAEYEDLSLELPLTIVDEVRVVKAENSTIDTTSLDLATEEKAKVVVMLKDQYGDPINGKIEAATASNAKDVPEEIATTTSDVTADETGKAELIVSASEANAGEGKLEIKVDDVKIGEINVKVAAPGEVAKYELRLAADNEATIDMKDADKTITLNLVGLDKNGLVTENVTKTDAYSVKSSDDKVAEVAWGKENITVTGKQPGNATITVEFKEGALVTGTWTFNIEVVDTKAEITGVTFEEDIPKLTDNDTGITLDKVIKVAGITVNPDVEIKFDELNIKEKVKDATSVKIGEIKLTPIGLGEDIVNFADGTIKLTTGAAGTTGYINVAVLDVYGNLVGEVDIEVAIPADE